MSTKTSANAKVNYGKYSAESRSVKNKEAKIARHMKAHPNDAQSSARKPSTCSGKTHEKKTPLESSLHRAVKHMIAFGSGAKPVAA